METFMWGSLLCRRFPRIRQFCNVLPLIPALWPWHSYLMSLVLIFLIKQKSCVAYLTDSCKDQMGQCCESSLAWRMPHTVNSGFLLPLQNYRLNYFRIQEKEKMYLYRAWLEVFQVEMSLYLGQDSDSEVVYPFQGRGSGMESKTRVEMLGNVLGTWSGEKSYKLGWNQVAECLQCLGKSLDFFQNWIIIDIFNFTPN